MRIAVDARSVYQEHTLRGVGQSLLGLYKGLSKARPSWVFDMYYQVSNGTNYFNECSNINNCKIDGPGDRFGTWQELWLPIKSWVNKSSVLHAHGAIAPKRSFTPLITTIHDLTPLDFWPNDPDVVSWGKNVSNGARKAKLVLTCSQYSKKQIIHKIGIPESKIRVVYWGPNELHARIADSFVLEQTRCRYKIDIDKKYLLHFGMSLPRKNTARLLESWARLPRDVQGDNQLVIVGLEGDSFDVFSAKTRDLKIQDSVKLFGYVPDQDVPSLLSMACGLCYIPLSEGFGLPILDAFQCETPVIASRVASIPEVTGDAAYMVDPTNSAEITAAMLAILNDQEFREELVDKGLSRLKVFSWNVCAEQVASFFDTFQ